MSICASISLLWMLDQNLHLFLQNCNTSSRKEKAQNFLSQQGQHTWRQSSAGSKSFIFFISNASLSGFKTSSAWVLSKVWPALAKAAIIGTLVSSDLFMVTSFSVPATGASPSFTATAPSAPMLCDNNNSLMSVELGESALRKKKA